MKPTIDEIRSMSPITLAARFAEIDDARAAAEERAGAAVGERQRITLLVSRVLSEVDADESMSDSERLGARRAITAVIARLDKQE